jgi:hypothetical protein
MKRSWLALAALGGVYSSPSVWTSIFGTGTGSLIPDTYEWTYEPETTSYSGAYPYDWCLDHAAGPCVQFFGGQSSSSPYALMWQWSGGAGLPTASAVQRRPGHDRRHQAELKLHACSSSEPDTEGSPLPGCPQCV